MGRNGGESLARAPEAITLRDIYQASVADQKLWMARTDIRHRCTVSRNVEQYFEGLEAEADLALTKMLAGRMLSGSYAELERMDAVLCAPFSAEYRRATTAGTYPLSFNDIQGG